MDLILLEIQDFDVILGMDFLTKHNATMDCKAKMVSLKNGDSIIKFQGQSRPNEKRWIFALQAYKMLLKEPMGT